MRFSSLCPLSQFLAIGGLPLWTAVLYCNRAWLHPYKETQVNANELLNHITAMEGRSWRCKGVRRALLIRAVILAFIAVAWAETLLGISRIPLPWPLWGFYTMQTFVLTTIYFTTCLVLSFMRYLGVIGKHSSSVSPAGEWGLRALHLLYQYLLSANILVTVGFWTITRLTINRYDRFPYLLSMECAVHHVLNSTFMFVEYYVNESPIEARNFDLIALGPTVYFTFVVLTFGAVPSIALDFQMASSVAVVMLLIVSVMGYHLLWALGAQVRQRKGSCCRPLQEQQQELADAENPYNDEGGGSCHVSANGDDVCCYCCSGGSNTPTQASKT